jgi:hypothetical protein
MYNDNINIDDVDFVVPWVIDIVAADIQFW